MFISSLYMFLANMCPSSGEISITMRYLVFICHSVWMTVLYAYQSDKYQVSHRYTYFS